MKLSDFNSKSLTRDRLISHAMFLYKASWQPPKTADLWFATMQDEHCLRRKLYVQIHSRKDRGELTSGENLHPTPKEVCSHTQRLSRSVSLGCRLAALISQ